MKNNPDLPSYVHDSLIDVMPELALVSDVWTGLRKGFTKYIRKEREEPDEEYKKRLERTVFDNLFTPTIKGYSGLLAQFKISEDTAASIVARIDNVDGQGNSLEVFLSDADDLVLRDGCVAFLVDFPKTEGLDIVSPLDLERSGLSPYVSLIDRQNIINWDFEIEAGVTYLSFVIVRSGRPVKVGKYGAETKTIYREFRRGTEETSFKCIYLEWEIKTIKGVDYAELVNEPRAYSKQEIPMALYSTTDRNPLSTLPPFINAANLNVQLLRKQSELDEVMHKINMPVPVRRGMQPIPDITSSTGMRYPAVVIGPNSVQDLPVDGDFKFEEPTGAAIASTEQNIKELKGAIDRVSLAFLSGDKSGAMTATEALLNTAQVTTTIAGIARRKESVVQSVFDLWVSYTGEPIGGTIAIDDSIIKTPLSDQGAQVILDAMGVSISRELGFELLKDRRWLPEGTLIEEELTRLAQMGVS